MIILATVWNLVNLIWNQFRQVIEKKKAVCVTHGKKIEICLLLSLISSIRENSQK